MHECQIAAGLGELAADPSEGGVVRDRPSRNRLWMLSLDEPVCQNCRVRSAVAILRRTSAASVLDQLRQAALARIAGELGPVPDHEGFTARMAASMFQRVTGTRQIDRWDGACMIEWV
jgi:hypothetical protein